MTHYREHDSSAFLDTAELMQQKLPCCFLAACFNILPCVQLVLWLHKLKAHHVRHAGSGYSAILSRISRAHYFCSYLALGVVVGSEMIRSGGVVFGCILASYNCKGLHGSSWKVTGIAEHRGVDHDCCCSSPMFRLTSVYSSRHLIRRDSDGNGALDCVANPAATSNVAAIANLVQLLNSIPVSYPGWALNAMG